MPNIATLLNNIMTAIYGEQVRESIHDAIEAINDVVSNWEAGLMDDTLTSTTLPAQGKAVGDAIAGITPNALLWKGTLADGTDLDDLSDHGGYTVSKTSSLTNAPSIDATGNKRYIWIDHYNASSGDYYMYYYNYTKSKLFVRLHSESLWGDWKDLTEGLENAYTHKGSIPGSTEQTTVDLDDYKEVGVYTMGYTSEYAHEPIGKYARRLLIVYGNPATPSYRIQYIINGLTGQAYTRVYTEGSWTAWKNYTDDAIADINLTGFIKSLSADEDLNDLSDHGTYGIGQNTVVINAPIEGDTGRRNIWINHANLSSSVYFMYYYKYNTNKLYVRIHHDNTWEDWKDLTEGLERAYTSNDLPPIREGEEYVDLDDATTPGTYILGYSNTFLHCPIGNKTRRTLIVYGKHEATYRIQYLFNALDCIYYTRIFAGTSWGEWHSIADSIVNYEMYNDGSAEHIRYPLNTSSTSDPYTNRQKVVTLLHFTDLHITQNRYATFEELMHWASVHASAYDDILCTGDIVDAYTEETGIDYMAPWKAVDGAENILVTIGNHDAKDENSSSKENWIHKTMARCRELYMYGIDSWGVTSPAGSTYWYKDYDNSDLRLIGLDTTLQWRSTGNESVDNSNDSAQQTWLINLLSDSKTAGKSVVIAQHYPPTSKDSTSSRVKVACDFCTTARNFPERGTYNSLSLNDAYLEIVQDFIDAGGKFVCWLGGHSHNDLVLKDVAYPDQIFFILTSLWNDLRTSDQARTKGTRSFIAANVIGFDTARHLIKISRVGANYDQDMRPRNVLVYDYDNKQVVYQSSGIQES